MLVSPSGNLIRLVNARRIWRELPCEVFREFAKIRFAKERIDE
jgi:hypothetical protein